MRRVIHLISWGLGVSVLAAQNNESPEALLDALLPDAEKIEEALRRFPEEGPPASSRAAAEQLLREG